jgi:hypothetical protein
MTSDNSLVVGIFTLLGVIVSSGVNLVSGYLSNRSQAKLEWQKHIQPNLFKAYDSLYKFISFARRWYPPSEERKEFLELINSHHFKEITGNMIFFNSEIKAIIKEFLSVYDSITDMDSGLDPAEVLDKFWHDLNSLLNKLEKLVEKQTEKLNLF